MEARARTNPASVEAFGEVPSVPWLDALQKERAKQLIADALADGNVCRHIFGSITLANYYYSLIFFYQ
jgi:hypothetical protein